MADEDEIDVLGDFNLDNLLSRREHELFNYESCNSQWLLDSSTSCNNWFSFNNFTNEEPSPPPSGLNQTSDVAVKNSHKWTSEEKSLCEKAVDIFGHNEVNIAQFIGSKTPAQVKRFIKKRTKITQNRHVANLLTSNQQNNELFVSDNVICESQIPATIEEVIASIETAQPTINIQKKTMFNNKIKNRKSKKGYSKANLELVTGKGQSVQLSSKEQVIKIEKNNIDTDSDIDIEDEGDNEKKIKAVEEKIKEESQPSISNDLIPAHPSPPQPPTAVRLTFTTLNLPFEECSLPECTITDEERYFNYEFFEGRSTKTPERYLKIRNHILQCWRTSKPIYVTKTSVRSGLKHCGDVNSISRIHLYLEQIGAINFGCENVEYIRPLMKLFSLAAVAPSEARKRTKSEENTYSTPSRQRNKKKIIMSGEGGYTFTHNEQGDVIETTVVSKEKNTRTRKQPIKLICCKSFSGDAKAPYQVKINITALLSMDWHAHSSLEEVMGLLGGRYEPHRAILSIEKYIPCESSTNSATHCDMCPVSQARAYEQFQRDGLTVVGWFHSHPTFSPSPSDQDLETQLNMQKWLCGSADTHNVPFVGIILSPFNHFSNSTYVSEYRCLIIRQLTAADGGLKTIPYKFNTQVISDAGLEKFISQLQNIFRLIIDGNKFNFLAPYLNDHSINYLDKMIESTKIHLAQCSSLNKMSCDSIVTSARNIVTSLVRQKKITV